MIVSNILIEALAFNKVAAMGYAIYNKLLGCSGWKSVSKLLQDTTADILISRIKIRVGRMHQDERKKGLKRKEDESDYEDSSNSNTSSDQPMDETTEQEEGEDLSPDFVKKFIRLKWDCVTHGVPLAALECPFLKPYI
jgi:hypothetical protein